MSLSSLKGKGFEQLVAKMIRSKLSAQVMRDRRSGAGVNKSDVSDWYGELPLSIECKDQATIKIKEWFRQAAHARSGRRAPAVVFHADSEILVTLRFTDLLDFLVEIADQQAQIQDMRQPRVNRPTEQLKERLLTQPGTTRPTCRNGHLADEYGYCLYLGCQYARGYRAPKTRRK